jgi:4-amino-4-deoxy-L-arabinose transferase-like glycosyltransferase
MAGFFKQRWFLFLVLAVFIICKIPHLFYAYYWDASWPYAAAITQMYHHGLSLMPNAVDAELSRGHPLFFHFIAAGWMNIFGHSHLTMHSFALCISVLFLIAIYEAGLRIFNQRVAVLSLLLVAMQEAFFVQSSFLLLEILVAFLVFLSLYLYVSGRYVLTAISLSMLFYTKESGLILGFVLGIDALISLFNKNTEWRIRLQKLMAVGVPCVLIVIFFLLQKYIRGWYIFPYYSGLIEHNWVSIWYNFRNNCLRNTFHEYMKYYYFSLMLVLCLIAAIKNANLRYLAVFLPVACIYCLIDEAHLSKILPGIPFFILFISSIVFFIYNLRKLKFFADTRQESFFTLSIIFILCYFCFSSFDFFTYRYLFAALIPLLFITAVIMDMAISRTSQLLYYPVFLAIAVIAYFSIHLNDNSGDCDLGAFHALDVQQKAVAYLEQQHAYDKRIGCNSYLARVHLNDPGTGFLHSDTCFKYVTWDFDNTDYVLFDNIEPDQRYEDFKKNPSYHRVYRYENHNRWTEIYKKN